tara:strand:+ start:1145 stop:1942 length:798 start_codon:yes stop_codon:yes gene_type:complete
MKKVELNQLLEAGVHFGHLTSKRHPNMSPYIFMEKNGMHIIDLNKTKVKLDQALLGLKKIAKSGRKILFVATKKQSKFILEKYIQKVNMPYITERWYGGMLTNFVTIRKTVKKLDIIDRMKEDGTIETLSKRERLQMERDRAKLDKYLGSISDMNRLPAAVFVVDILREKIAVQEASKLNIKKFAMVDTNSNPDLVDFPIPSNDDASKSIDIILSYVFESIEEGLMEREKELKAQKDQAAKKEQKNIDNNDSNKDEEKVSSESKK